MTALNEGHLKEASDNGPIERRDVASCRRSETGSSLTGPSSRRASPAATFYEGQIIALYSRRPACGD